MNKLFVTTFALAIALVMGTSQSFASCCPRPAMIQTPSYSMPASMPCCGCAAPVVQQPCGCAAPIVQPCGCAAPVDPCCCEPKPDPCCKKRNLWNKIFHRKSLCPACPAKPCGCQ